MEAMDLIKMIIEANKENRELTEYIDQLNQDWFAIDWTPYNRQKKVVTPTVDENAQQMYQQAAAGYNQQSVQNNGGYQQNQAMAGYPQGQANGQYPAMQAAGAQQQNNGYPPQQAQGQQQNGQPTYQNQMQAQ